MPTGQGAFARKHSTCMNHSGPDSCSRCGYRGRDEDAAPAQGEAAPWLPDEFVVESDGSVWAVGADGSRSMARTNPDNTARPVIARYPMFRGERRARLAEWAWQRAATALPARLRYWALIHEGARHCGGPAHPTEEVPAVPFTVVLERAGKALR